MYLMMVLIPLLESSHNRYGLRRRRLVHHHHLETPFKGLVRLKIFLVLVKGRRAYCTKLTSRESRLQDIGCIHSSGCPPCAYECMNLIYKEDHLTLAVHDFLDDSLQPLFKFSLIFGSGNKGSEVK